jgi:hypothetical protein
MASVLQGRRVFRGIGLAVCLVSVLACGEQGEGERCDLDNGDSDCESGLVCTPASDLIRVAGGDSPGAALCCPAQGQASVSACIAGSFGGGGGVGGSGAATGGAGGSTAGAGGAGASGGAGGSTAGAGGTAGAGTGGTADAGAGDASQ